MTYYDLTFRPIAEWPAGWQNADRHKTRLPPPFSATYSDTLIQLYRELTALGTERAFVQLDVKDRDIRNDGALRADTKVGHPGVILTAETRKHGALTYATDRFDGRSIYRGYDKPLERVSGWQMNLRAIALGLQSLRQVDRYGIAEQGEQYAGYKAIGTGIELHAAALTVEEAARVLIVSITDDRGRINVGDYAGEPIPPDLLPGDPGRIADYYRLAVLAHHPDRGGNADIFRRVTEARDILRADCQRRANADANGDPR